MAPARIRSVAPEEVGSVAGEIISLHRRAFASHREGSRSVSTVEAELDRASHSIADQLRVAALETEVIGYALATVEPSWATVPPSVTLTRSLPRNWIGGAVLLTELYATRRQRPSHRPSHRGHRRHPRGRTARGGLFRP